MTCYGRTILALSLSVVFFSFFNFQGFPFSVLWTLTKISDNPSFRIQVTYMVFEMIWLSGLMLTPKNLFSVASAKTTSVSFFFLQYACFRNNDFNVLGLWNDIFNKILRTFADTLIYSQWLVFNLYCENIKIHEMYIFFVPS